MRRALAGLLLLALAGCALGQPIAQQAVDYNHAVEAAANALLVTNVLRARDEAPLHFTSMPQIRGSLSVGLSQPGIGLPIAGSQQGLNLGLSGSNSPSFDVSALDTQDFIRGLLEPLESQIIRYYWDRGYPDQLILMLLFSAVEEAGTGRRFINDPRCWLDRPDCPGQENSASLQQALELNLALGRPAFHPYTALIPVGPPLTPAQAAEPALLAMLAEAKTRLLPAPGGRFQLHRVEQRVAVCRRRMVQGRLVLLRPGTPPADQGRDSPYCLSDEQVEREGAPGSLSARGQQAFVRSVQEIFRFLGVLVKVQAQMPPRRNGTANCIYFGLGEARPGTATRRACLFQLLPGEGPAGAVTVEHAGLHFHVPAFREPGEGGNVGDYSMRVLALLSDLVNLKKSSSSIPSTRAVQIVR